MKLLHVHTPQIERDVTLRHSDRQAWSDAFTGLYHVPPAEMPTPRTVLDLGANIGLTAAHYQYLWPHALVVAVEMSPGNAALIPLNAPDARVRVEAVAEYSGWGWYEPALDPLDYRYEPGSAPLAPGSGRSRVVAHNLGQIIARAFDAPAVVDFCKMDVEGAEWGVLQRPAPWQEKIRHLLVELHSADISATQSQLLVLNAIKLLAAAGFSARPHNTHPRAVYAWRP